MRVVIDYRSALREPTGVGAYAHGLAEALARRFENESPSSSALTVFSSSWKDRLALPPALAGVDAIDLRVPVTVLNFAWHRLEWPPIERLTGRSFDVAHSLHPLLMPAGQAAQVITIYDLNFLKHPERSRAEVRRDYPGLAAPHAARADRIIVSSGFAATEVESRLHVPPDRISICYPGRPDWTPRTTAPAAGYVLFVGTLEPRKNVGTLLDAYERLIGLWRDSPPASRGPLPELVLAGRSLPETQAWLDRIARPPLAGRVRHIGYFEMSARRSIYEGARLLVQPSWEEGFGFPVLEAMTMGVPVVSANRGSLPEVLGDAGLLVDPQDAVAMAAAMHRMLTDGDFAQSCTASGISRSRRFDWAATAADVCEGYRLAIERRKNRG